MTYKLAIFDWDGTLMDSTGKIVSAMQKAAQQHAQPVPTEHAVRQIIGISLVPAIEKLFDLRQKARAEAIAEAYSFHYRELDTQPCSLFDGVVELLTTLRKQGTHLAVATGKGRPGLNRVLNQSALTNHFCVTRTADEAESKPSPDMLEQILNELDVAAGDALMIGDTEHDMVMAKRIGMARVGVDYGAHSTEQLKEHEPLDVISHSLQLLNYF